MQLSLTQIQIPQDTGSQKLCPNPRRDKTEKWGNPRKKRKRWTQRNEHTRTQTHTETHTHAHTGTHRHTFVWEISRWGETRKRPFQTFSSFQPDVQPLFSLRKPLVFLPAIEAQDSPSSLSCRKDHIGSEYRSPASTIAHLFPLNGLSAPPGLLLICFPPQCPEHSTSSFRAR